MSAERLGGGHEFEPGLREKCGLFGIIDTENNVGPQIISGLLALQHRGQEAAGVSMYDERLKKISSNGDKGLVSEVFDSANVEGLPDASIGIGHTRYGTVDISQESQPFQPFDRDVNGYHFAIAHNGNLTFIDGQPVEANAYGSDTEQLANKLAHHIETHGGDIASALPHVLERVEGAYSLVVMDKEKLMAVRDPHGFRPLSMGVREGSVVFASETGALDIVEARQHTEVNPGEIVTTTRDGSISFSKLPFRQDAERTSCVIEHVYFAHESHEESGESTVARRMRMGAKLAEEFPYENVDAVTGVPGTGIPIADGYARASGIDTVKAIIKNQYVGRSFIKPTQSERETTAQQKFQVVRDQVEGKRLVVIDDSIVRGTNTKTIVRKLRTSGAAEIHFLAASPSYRYPCHFGVDTGRPHELLANRHEGDVEAMRQELGVDSLGFLSLKGLREAINIEDDPFCDACLSGNYPVPVQLGMIASRHSDSSLPSKH